MNKTAAWPTALALALVCAGSAAAHHSYLAYQTTPLWIEGLVVGFEHENPHTRIMLEERSADGQMRLWAVEGPGQTALDRRGADLSVPKVGDRLKVCAFAYKSADDLSRIWPEIDFSTQRYSQLIEGTSPRFVSGHVLVTLGGNWQVWSNGTLSECILSSDDPRLAPGFLNSNPGARQSWCKETSDDSVIRLDASRRALVDEIDKSLDKPCG
jgi:hypothetical protein